MGKYTDGMNTEDYTAIWLQKDAITTIVDANGYGVWDLHPTENGFQLELDARLDDESIEYLCAQMPLTADYGGEGDCGSVICLYN